MMKSIDILAWCATVLAILLQDILSNLLLIVHILIGFRKFIYEIVPAEIGEEVKKGVLSSLDNHLGKIMQVL